jgi:endoglucanase
MRSTAHQRSVVMEACEGRRLLSDPYSWTTPEVESNAVRSRATPASLAMDGITRLQGVSKSNRDVDYFVLSADRTGALRVSVTNLTSAGVRVRVEGERGTTLLETETSGRLFVGAGQKYFVRVLSKTAGRGGYSIKLEAPQTVVSDARFEKLRTGINIPGWFWNFDFSRDIADPFSQYMTDTDARQLKQLGVRHVRVPIDVKFVMSWDKPDQFNSQTMQRIDQAVSLLTRNGLAVILCPFGDHQDRIVESAYYDRVLKFQAAWAKHFSNTDPEMVFLQVANEPNADPYIWQPVHRQLVRVMRENAPGHTFISGTPLKFGPQSDQFGTIEALTTTVPMTDKNIVYSLHYYEPFFFTHQGVGFGPVGYQYLNNVPYPADTNNTKWVSDKLRREVPDANLRDYLADSVLYFGQSGWNKDRLAARIKVVGDWARFYNVRVIADEFGVVDQGAVNPSHRQNWLRDVRSAFEANNIAWSMWDYDQGFGIVTGDPGARFPKSGTVAALGLNGS